MAEAELALAELGDPQELLAGLGTSELWERQPARLQAVLRSQLEQLSPAVRQAGERALLNLGHTFGHAIETGVGYGEWLHGEAVAAGTMMAAQLSHQLGWIDRHDLARVEQLLQRAGLPVAGPMLSVERYLELMQHDKKVHDGRSRLVLLQRLGHAVLTDQAPLAQVRQAIAERTAHA